MNRFFIYRVNLLLPICIFFLQVKIAKERKKGDKIIADSQERAFWRVYRPPPGVSSSLEPCPVPSRDRQGRTRRRTLDDVRKEVSNTSLNNNNI